MTQPDASAEEARRQRREARRARLRLALMDESVPSPCIAVCQVDETSSHCIGCGRTLDEIREWPLLRAEQKRAVLERLAAAGFPLMVALPSSNGTSTWPRTGLLMLLGVTLGWGMNWPALKAALSEMPVWTFRFVLVAWGGIGSLMLARLFGQRVWLRPEEVWPVLVCTFFNMLTWNVFSAYGVAYSTGGKSAMVAYTMPIWASAMAPLVVGERLGRWTLLGLGCGAAGLAVLLGGELRSLGDGWIGTLSMLAGAVCWAYGTVLTKRYALALPAMSFVGWQFLLCAPPLFAGMLVLEGWPSFELSSSAWAGLIYNLLVPMLFVHYFWFRAVQIFPASIASICTLAVPVVGFIASAAILGEAIEPLAVVALLLISSALVAVLLGPVVERRLSRREAAGR